MATTPISAAEVSGAPTENQVHVWRIPLEVVAAPGRDFSDLLSPVEQARAARFVRDEDRCRFQIGRAATRRILGKYLGVPPAQVGIDPDGRGKPQLNATMVPLERQVHFNLSHSRDWILAAFAHTFPVGIDVESVRAATTSEDLADYLMSEGERRAFNALPQAKRPAAFLQCWTSKEAFLKGTGVGLTAALRSIEVSIDPDQPAQLLAAPPELCPGDWQLHRLGFSAPYTAILAVAAKSAEIVDIAVDSWRDIHC
jgi:4'-phosphopantetheinyl transferase